MKYRKVGLYYGSKYVVAVYIMGINVFFRMIIYVLALVKQGFNGNLADRKVKA
ncbi:hypothetical protein SAMN04488514_10758 [Kriegella aquimaris]|uniref:Uncharacterized protein n=1 Tax=Kriegella aquimaris TaxID=192904 RepID=A0A1G9S2T5_9FLAO|nr:hypothetical protein SAMN04488514_10758 [Kriegella aquimaris]